MAKLQTTVLFVLAIVYAQGTAPPYSWFPPFPLPFPRPLPAPIPIPIPVENRHDNGFHFQPPIKPLRNRIEERR